MNNEFTLIQQNKTPNFTIDENAVDSSRITIINENFNDIEIRTNSKINLLPPKTKFHLKKCSTMEFILTPITEISMNLVDTSLNGTPPSSRNYSQASQGKFFF